jgi:hypothetical protein
MPKQILDVLIVAYAIILTGLIMVLLFSNEAKRREINHLNIKIDIHKSVSKDMMTRAYWKEDSLLKIINRLRENQMILNNEVATLHNRKQDSFITNN